MGPHHAAASLLLLRVLHWGWISGGVRADGYESLWDKFHSLPTCSSPQPWMENQDGQDPCTVLESLLRSCDSSFNPGDIAGDFNKLQHQPCACNSVSYSLLSACYMCAPGQLDAADMTWSSYKKLLGCSSGAPVGSYPDPPPGIDIPAWAFLPLKEDRIDINEAQIEGATPPSSGPPPTTPIAPTTTPVPVAPPGSSEGSTSDASAGSTTATYGSSGETSEPSRTLPVGSDSANASPPSSKTSSTDPPSMGLTGPQSALGDSAGTSRTAAGTNAGGSDASGFGSYPNLDPSSSPALHHPGDLNPKHSNHTGVLVGGVLGGIIAAILAAVLALCLVRRSRRRRREKQAMLANAALDWGAQPGGLENSPPPERELSDSSTIRVDDIDDQETLRYGDAVSLEKKSIKYGNYPDQDSD